MIRSDRGFTLLELLIGMTLLGFLLALLFGGFRLASRSWDAVTERTESTSAEQLARGVVRRLVSQAQPMRWKKGINQKITFSGESERLVAIVPLSGPLGAGGLAVVELTTASGQKGAGTTSSLRLVLRMTPLQYQEEVFSAGLENSEEHVLLAGLDSASFSYFGVEKPGAAPAWLDTWQNPDELPKLVRLHLQSADDSWTDLVVAPMVTASNCHWDSFYKRCL